MYIDITNKTIEYGKHHAFKYSSEFKEQEYMKQNEIVKVIQYNGNNLMDCLYFIKGISLPKSIIIKLYDFIVKDKNNNINTFTQFDFHSNFKKIYQINVEEVTSHYLNNKNIKIDMALGKNSKTPTRFFIKNALTGDTLTELIFQDGPIKEYDINGVQNEDLIVCLLTRLNAFQNGPFKCRENELAINNLEKALMWLKSRTEERKSRKVEGLNIK